MAALSAHCTPMAQVKPSDYTQHIKRFLLKENELISDLSKKQWNDALQEQGDDKTKLKLASHLFSSIMRTRRNIITIQKDQYGFLEKNKMDKLVDEAYSAVDNKLLALVGLAKDLPNSYILNRLGTLLDHLHSQKNDAFLIYNAY